MAANTLENSTKVHCVSITLCISFERGGKALKGLQVRREYQSGQSEIEERSKVPPSKTEG